MLWIWGRGYGIRFVEKVWREGEGEGSISRTADAREMKVDKDTILYMRQPLKSVAEVIRTYMYKYGLVFFYFYGKAFISEKSITTVY